MNCPLSVIMTVHNGEAHIREAVASVLNQTYEDFEMIVVDNNSTDRSVSVVESFSDRRIKVFPLGRNIDRTPALNLALRQATGRYFAILDADDIAYPARLALQVRYLISNPEVALVAGRVDWFDIYGPISQTERFLPSDVEISWNLIFTDPLAHSSVVMRREVALACGGYDEAFRYAQDYELYCAMMRNGFRLACVREKVGAIRLSPTSFLNTGGDLRRTELAETRLRNLRHFLFDLSVDQLNEIHDVLSGGARKNCERAVEAAINAHVKISSAISLRQPADSAAMDCIQADLARRIAFLGWANRQAMPHAAELADSYIKRLTSGSGRRKVYVGLSEACLSLAVDAGSREDRRQFKTWLRRAISFALCGTAPLVSGHAWLVRLLVENAKTSLQRGWWVSMVVCCTLACTLDPFIVGTRSLSLLLRRTRRIVKTQHSMS